MQSTSPSPDNTSAPVNPKRKRLAKACDACHKSKRRCDGTATCSNCYFASKECTYTDSSGKPVPAPKGTETVPHRAKKSMDVSMMCQPTRSANTKGKKRTRSESDASDTVVREPHIRPAGLEANLVRELVNLFFAHCHPHRMMFHKPSFLMALSHNKLPSYLILAMCAVAAPHSATMCSRSDGPTRLAGQRLYAEALGQVFDAGGALIPERNLLTVQTLCLLEMHEVNGQYAWTKNFRYHALALHILLNVLQIEQPNAPNTTARELNDCIERECMRRCYWLIYFVDLLCTACTRLPTLFPSPNINIRLPVDETSFEMGVQSAMPEFINQPAARSNYASEFGHLIRAVKIFKRTEDYLSVDDQEVVHSGMVEIDKEIEIWKSSLPGHLRFSEDNLRTQESMFETGSNGGAWCYYYIHASQACCEILSAKARNDSSLAEYSNLKQCVYRIVNSLGRRVKNLNYLAAAVLWPLSRHCAEDTEMRALDAQFESMWGYKCLDIAPTWRKHNKMERTRELQLPQDTIARRDVERTLPSLKAVGLLNSAASSSSSSSFVDTTTNLPPLAWDRN